MANMNVLKVGVTCTRYVSLKNARPWVIHAYRNIKGRGLHVDEDVHNVAPISQDESTLGMMSDKANQKPSESSCLIYEEHHDDVIDIPVSERASTSKEAKDETKKIKLSSDSKVGENVTLGEHSFETTGDPGTAPDDDESVAGKKRKRSGVGEEEGSVEQTVETEHSDKSACELTEVQELIQSKRMKLNASNDEIEVHQSHEAQATAETTSVRAELGNTESVKHPKDKVESAKEATYNLDSVKNTTTIVKRAKDISDNTECAKDSTNNLESAKDSTGKLESASAKDRTDNVESSKDSTDNLEKGIKENVEITKGNTDNSDSANNSNENIESAKNTTVYDGHTQMDTNDTQTAGDKGTTPALRSLRKRKKKDVEEKTVKSTEPIAVSTYDKVRLVIQPWRKPEGGLNKDVLKMMLESVMLFLMMNPGCPVTEVDKRYSPYLQPMVLMNLIEILEDIGCVTKQYIKKQKPSLFSKPTLPQIVHEEENGCMMLLLPTDDCVLKMGLFGQEAFPNAKWPDTCYPTVIGQKTTSVNN